MKIEVTLPGYWLIKEDGTKVKMTKEEMEEYERTHEVAELVLVDENEKQIEEMTSYIDKDKLIRDLIDNRNFYPVIVKNAIEQAPAEDVVPRSEMEKLQTVIFMKEDLTQKIAEERNQYGYEVVELKDKVEELQKQLEPFKEIGCFTCKWYGVMCNHAPCYKCKEFSQYIWLSAGVETSENSIKSEVEKAKQEVAREIFEKLRQEIKSAFDSNYQAKKERIEKHYNGMIVCDDFISLVNGKMQALSGIYDLITEFEKKYIGE